MWISVWPMWALDHPLQFAIGRGGEHLLLAFEEAELGVVDVAEVVDQHLVERRQLRHRGPRLGCGGGGVEDRPAPLDRNRRAHADLDQPALEGRSAAAERDQRQDDGPGAADRAEDPHVPAEIFGVPIDRIHGVEGGEDRKAPLSQAPTVCPGGRARSLR